MLKREEKALRKLIAELKVSEAMPYSSDPDFDSGVDHGRDNAAEELEWLLNDLVKSKDKK